MARIVERERQTAGGKKVINISELESEKNFLCLYCKIFRMFEF